MQNTPDTQQNQDGEMGRLLEWCSSIVGPCNLVSGDKRIHDRSTVCRLQTPSGHCYLKIHRQRASWEREVHGYEQWSPCFDTSVPNLLAVYEDDPLALLVDDLPGRVMQSVELPVEQEVAVWRAAGQALIKLHNLANGEYFGSCRRDGTPAEEPTHDAVQYISTELKLLISQAAHANLLNENEMAVVRSAQELTPAFANEQPVPCHRDYGPDNWLVTGEGTWAGVIDFEMAHWDVRVADFSRYPNWEWILKPYLLDAFFEGYGRHLTQQEGEQLLVARTHYALGAIVWGREHSFYGFMEEGHEALKYLTNCEL